MRITVNDVVGWLAHGMTEEDILGEHAGLEKDDFPSVYAFAADIADRTSARAGDRLCESFSIKNSRRS
jgi:uncharacterized protein (DUF433 family)